VSESIPPLSRLFLAWLAFFRVLFDGAFAARVARARLPEAKPEPRKPAPTPTTPTPALQLLALFQREGRLVDFLEQDIAGFSDADVGAAARVVHDGCRKALRAHAKLVAVRDEEEGARVTLDVGFDAAAHKLTGDVRGSAPFEGVLRHRGWRATDLSLPKAVDGHDASVIAPAEIEL
jgi:hypothetical protein